MTAGKLFWIDAVKALCMLMVYLLHSEVYYGTDGVRYSYIFLSFYVNAFFFVSGYLFFRKYLDTNVLTKFNGGGIGKAFKTYSSGW